MSVLLDSLRLGDDTVHVHADSGTWRQVRAARPELVIDAVAGLLPVPGGVVLAGRELGRLDPPGRWERGLATATCRLRDLPGLAVLEIVLLGRRHDRVAAWAAALGGRGARTRLADAEAAVRGLAGRLGLAPWLDREAVGLHPHAAALADLARALAAAPTALVWQRPTWLPAADVDGIIDAVSGEQQRLGCTVIEVVPQ